MAERVSISRNPELCSRRDYDLIIVGGGIYGAMLSLEAVFRGLRPLLLDRGDFGCATSFNSLRIVHGGLRYLQKLDLRRHFESVQERRWFLAHFPDLVRPLPCLMPLYGKGVKRKSIFRAALTINDVLSISRNNGLESGSQIPGGSIVGKSETIDIFPDVEQRQLQGAAIWHDAAVPDSQRALLEVLRWAAHYGADAVNYVQVEKLVVEGGEVRGVMAQDREAGGQVSFRAPVVVNAGGPWSEEIATRMGAGQGKWFWPTLAWNMLMDKPALSKYALAITPPRAGGPTYFLNPWKGRLFVGTGHSRWAGPLDEPMPSGEQVKEMLDDVNASIPGLALRPGNIERVFPGLLPGAGPRSGRISTKPSFVDHSKRGGPAGLFSICGVKFTTARQVAARTLDKVFGGQRPAIGSKFPRPNGAEGWQSHCVDFTDDGATRRYLESIGELAAEESAMNLRDVVFRRTDLWERPELASRLAPEICDSFDWPQDRKAAELTELAHALENPWSLKI